MFYCTIQQKTEAFDQCLYIMGKNWHVRKKRWRYLWYSILL